MKTKDMIKEKVVSSRMNMEGGRFLPYKQQWERIELEFIFGNFIHWIVNLLLLFPTIFIQGVS